MLHNPSWNKSKNILSVNSLIQWLETKPPDGRYSYISIKDCMLCAYFRDMGLERVIVDPFWVGHSGGEVFELPQSLDNISRGSGQYDWSFGGALERARRYT
jgi:hypothetical protein